MKCSKCGAEIDAGSVFCKKCGEPVQMVPEEVKEEKKA